MHPAEPVRQRVLQPNTVHDLAPAKRALADLGRAPLKQSNALQNLGKHGEVQPTTRWIITNASC